MIHTTREQSIGQLMDRANHKLDTPERIIPIRYIDQNGARRITHAEQHDGQWRLRFAPCTYSEPYESVAQLVETYALYSDSGMIEVA